METNEIKQVVRELYLIARSPLTNSKEHAINEMEIVCKHYFKKSKTQTEQLREGLKRETECVEHMKEVCDNYENDLKQLREELNTMIAKVEFNRSENKTLWEFCINENVGNPCDKITDAVIAEIKKLREECERYKWISVDEKLPDNFKHQMSLDVLTIAGTRMCVKAYDWQLNKWCGSPYFTVTHWMPLPSAPLQTTQKREG